MLNEVLGTLSVNAWPLSSIGLSLDILGFAILMGELASAQDTEIHVFRRDLIEGIRQARKEVKSLVTSTRSELGTVIEDSTHAHIVADSIFELYFSEGVHPYETYAAVITEHDLPEHYFNRLSLDEGNDVYLSIKRAIVAAKALGQSSVTRMSDVEQAMFESMYPLPETADWRSVKVWLNNEPSRTGDLPLFTDLASEFIELDLRSKSLRRRRWRFYLGAVLVIAGFATQLASVILE